MTDKKGKLLVFSAPSGSGKTTIVRTILSKYKELDFSVSATTRKRRENETDGKDYFFISEEEFKKKIDAQEFIEWERFYDYYYGTLKSFVDDEIDSGKSVVLEVDVNGAVNIKKNYPSAVLIFIMPPSFEELKNRLINRSTETESDLKKRIERAEYEFTYKDKFDYVVINDKLEDAVNKVCEIIEKEINQEV
ncbi:MAG: guanylate kinase [Melioribacteraceae bacterium]|nr:guanylate kinase [Melioribacteraceae bacterium]